MYTLYSVLLSLDKHMHTKICKSYVHPMLSELFHFEIQPSFCLMTSDVRDSEPYLFQTQQGTSIFAILLY